MPHHHLIARAAHKFGWDPAFQVKFHLAATCVWGVNLVLAVSVYVFAPAFWSRIGLLYVTILSLYANFSTDYGSVSAALAALRASESVDERREGYQ